MIAKPYTSGALLNQIMGDERGDKTLLTKCKVIKPMVVEEPPSELPHFFQNRKSTNFLQEDNSRNQGQHPQTRYKSANTKAVAVKPESHDRRDRQ